MLALNFLLVYITKRKFLVGFYVHETTVGNVSVGEEKKLYFCVSLFLAR